MKKVICYLLVFLMYTSMMTSPAYGAVDENLVFSDMPQNWSAPALRSAVDNGLMSGYNGKILPNVNLTRAELATIINRAFGATQKSSLDNYTDVAANAWYYDEMAKAVCMKTFVGTGKGQLNPEKPITRQEVFLVLANALKLSGTNTNVLNSFSDNHLISAWAKDATASFVSAGYVKGSEGQLKPQNLITRAELAQILDNIAKQYIRKEDSYSTDVTGNVMINVPNVTLKDMTITGDLIIGDGVGDGDVTLDGVAVTGRTIIRGGGKNSIKIIGNCHLETIIIARVNGEVRVYSEDGSQIGDVIVDGSDDVIVEGMIGNLIIKSPNIAVTATNANIKSATINGDNSNIIVDEKSEIGTLMVTSNHVTVSGTGKIVTVNANGSYINVTTPQTTVIAGQASNNVFAGTVQVAPNTTRTTPANKNNSSSGNNHSSSIQITTVDITGYYYSVGSVLTANVTPAAATVLYQWQRSDTVDGTYEDIIGGTSNSINLTSAELGKYIKVKVTGTGNYSGTVTSNPSQAIVSARIEGSSISHVYMDGGFTGTSNTISLFDTKFKEAVICEDLSNWTINTGSTNLTVSSITRNSDQTATINYSLKAAGQGTGTGTISIKANAEAVETNLDTNAINLNIVAPTYSITLGTITREAGDTQSTVSISSSAAVEGSQVTLTVNPKAGMKLKTDTLKVYYNDGTLKEAVLSGSGPYTFVMPAYPASIDAEFEYIYYNINFTAIGATVNGYGREGEHGSADIPERDLFFLGVRPAGTGYFEVYDVGGSQPGISGNDPNYQAYLLVTTLVDSYNFTIKQFKVYNPNGSAVTIKIKGWGSNSTHPPTEDGCLEKIAAANSWTTIDLTGFAGVEDISALTIDFPDNTALYFNDFVMRP